MKNKDLAYKDLAYIGGAIVLGIIVAVVASKVIFGGSSSTQTVEVVPSLSSTFSQPDPSYFNTNSIDPTQFIHINNNQNSSPFNSSSSTGQ